MSRICWSILANLVAPGSGLVVLRREWLGLAMAVWFVAAAQVVVLGWWIIPLEWNRAVVNVAAVMAVVAYGLAQGLLVRQVRLVTAPEVDREIAVLCDRCRDCLDAGDVEGAHRAMEVARRLNDEHVQAARLRARVWALRGRPQRSERWRRFADRHSHATPVDC